MFAEGDTILVDSAVRDVILGGRTWKELTARSGVFGGVAIMFVALVGVLMLVTQPPGIEQPETIYGKPIVATFEAKAIRAVDGDTVEILFPDKTHPNCRLESIDTPEPGSRNWPPQPFSGKASEAVKTLCIGKTVTVHQTGQDRNQRPLVFIVVDGVNLNAELLRRGLAWHYKEHSDDPELAAMEVEARDAKRGLWADPESMPPWEFRVKRKKEQKKRKAEKAKRK